METAGGEVSSPQDGYKVGYRHPPRAHSFKKGNSGNPSGRPKRNHINLEAAVNASLAETMTVRVNGKERRMTSLEAVLWSQMQSALRGNLNALKRIIKLANKTMRLESTKEIIGVLAVHDPEREAILAEFRALKAKGDPRAEISYYAAGPKQQIGE
jgi:hypothetical protein